MSYEPVLFLPAGKPEKIGGEYIPHTILDSNGKPILENIINEALSAGFKVVTTVRDSDYFKKTYKENDDVRILESREDLVDSALYGLMEGLVDLVGLPKFRKGWNNNRDIKKYIKENPEVLDLPVFYAGADTPFISKEDFLNLRNAYESNPSDILVMMSDVRKANKLEEELKMGLFDIDSTILNHCITDLGYLRVANGKMFKPFKAVKHGLTGTFQIAYNHRVMSKGASEIAGMAWGTLLLAGRSAKSFWNAGGFLYDVVQAGSHIWATKKGLDWPINLLGKINVEKVERHTTKVMGVDVRILPNGNVSTLLDIDDEPSLDFFRENYTAIKSYLNSEKKV
ncbi:hypothetical protein GOV05_03315 [Candidatus Woesearchaeota archaeon]|nr:hypothetical protein [Candidatus Woesearchaeota archaeon]